MNDGMASRYSVVTTVVVYKQYQLDLSAALEMNYQGGWKSTTMANGELYVMTISTILTPVLPAICSDLGIFLYLYCNIVLYLFDSIYDKLQAATLCLN